MLNYDSIYDINLINFNSLNLFLFIILTLICAILIDITFGELPVKIHPVVIIGHIINFFKNIFIKINNKISGLLLVVFTSIITLTIVALLIFFSTFNLIIYFIIFTILLSSTFSIKMLLETAINVKNNLDESLEKARESVSYLVSRNTQELTESFIVSATIENMTENITDSYGPDARIESRSRKSRTSPREYTAESFPATASRSESTSPKLIRTGGSARQFTAKSTSSTQMLPGSRTRRRENAPVSRSRDTSNPA